MKKYFLLYILLLLLNQSYSQTIISEGNYQFDYSNPKEYEIGGVTVTGVQYLDNNVLIMLSGLTVGEKIKIPGDRISKAIDNLWEQGFFENIKISITKIQDNFIFLNIDLAERPKLSKFSITGLRKGESDKIREEIKLNRGDIVTENLKVKSINQIKKYFVDKGFLNVQVDITEKKDTTILNYSILFINVKKFSKIKINSISIKGNNSISENKLKRSMKKTKELKLINLFSSKKFIEDDYKADKINLISRYNEQGFRDAKIVKDTFYQINDKRVNIDIKVDEGKKYYFRNINWVGNTKYKSEELAGVLRIKKGDIYNQKVLESNLYMNPDGRDVSSLYLDDGYLFFSINPVEVLVEGDSIDLEIRIYEGKQATVNKIIITGNTKTNDNVIYREIRTKPGQLFNRSDIIRTQRELSQLRYFNAEKLGVNPQPNPVDATVNIEYVVEETSSDQLELSGGWGAGRIVGTLGVSFNNFSTRNIFNKKAWTPLPAGDGQKLSLRAQSNGVWYQSYNASFTEPWLGGKKPNALTVSLYHTVQNINGLQRTDANAQSILINGITIGLGKRLRKPDDYFTLFQDVSLQNYDLKNFYSTFLFSTGQSLNLNYSISLGRNSVDAPIFARSGSDFNLTLQLTPPYSLFSKKDYTKLTIQERYKWTEYYKWKFNSAWYTKIYQNLVFCTKFKLGFLASYNNDLGQSPFERFYVGGDGLSGYALDGREIVALRGYSNESLTPLSNSGYRIGASAFNKYTMELRYPISLNPMATIYALTFVEAGNSWLTVKEFNPFDIKRAAGVGIRVFLPMFGLLGLDWGYGFDNAIGDSNISGGQFHFSINQSID